MKNIFANNAQFFLTPNNISTAIIINFELINPSEIINATPENKVALLLA